ncbi:hypothetical protein BKG88_10065 [Rodentibacter ratti]|uniref:Uncharacterized protein n=1 Tax=Rodentibacter ratti TaxID=1906745 RepID=A0A1V3L487_9PAST|nr:hypothetical protein BKG88_10065 [Rodentibacter ratti]
MEFSVTVKATDVVLDERADIMSQLHKPEFVFSNNPLTRLRERVEKIHRIFGGRGEWQNLCKN